MELPFPVVQRTYLASFEPARDAVEVESMLEEKTQTTLFQNTLTELDVQTTTESIAVRKEQQESADKGGERTDPPAHRENRGTGLHFQREMKGVKWQQAARFTAHAAASN